MTTQDKTPSDILPQPWDTDSLHQARPILNSAPLPNYSQPFPYDLIVFITRAQPFHNGHALNVEHALTLAKRVVVIVGSVGIARDTRNPFTFEERESMIYRTFENNPRLSVAPLRDHPYNDTIWSSYVQQIVDDYTNGDSTLRIGLIGHRKEDTCYYLDMFPQWEFIPMDNASGLNATMIRNAFFGESDKVRDWDNKIARHVSPQVSEFLTSFLYYFPVFKEGPKYKEDMVRLQREARFLEKHAKSWANAPYTPIFSTVDSVVIQSGHVLLIKRKAAPGEGLWAIPGGYLEPGERIVDGMMRELSEETKLKVPRDVIRGSVIDNDVFDYPNRSLRGRIVTHAFCVLLKSGPLPKIKAASDAKKAEWVPLNEFYKMQDQMFEDHFYIIDHFVSKLKDVKR